MKEKFRYRILMFAPAFAPFANPEAIVNSKLALAFLEEGWEVDVVSRNLAEESTYNYGSEWVEPWLPLKKVTHIIEYKAGSRLRRLAETLWSGIRMRHPIEGCRWASRAYDIASKLHRENKYDVILSRAFPNSAHLPSLIFSQKFNVPWIANWNDPWDFSNLPVAKGNLTANLGTIQGKFFEEVAIHASWHTFPSEKLRHGMCQYLGTKILERSSVVPHAALPTTLAMMPTDHKMFQIAFAGRSWKNRSPKLFLEAFATFIQMKKTKNQVIFLFIGIDDNDMQNLATPLGIGSNITFAGKRGYSETLNMLSKCDVLLLIDPSDADGMILTSKLVDYAQTGRPILAITTKCSTSDEIITNYGGGISIDYYSSESIVNALLELYSHWEKNTLDKVYGSYRIYRLFSPETIIDSYRNIFLQIGIKSLLS